VGDEREREREREREKRVSQQCNERTDERDASCFGSAGLLASEGCDKTKCFKHVPEPGIICKLPI
jgi:hypothetical protein